MDAYLPKNEVLSVPPLVHMDSLQWVSTAKFIHIIHEQIGLEWSGVHWSPLDWTVHLESTLEFYLQKILLEVDWTLVDSSGLQLW